MSLAVKEDIKHFKNSYDDCGFLAFAVDFESSKQSMYRTENMLDDLNLVLWQFGEKHKVVKTEEFIKDGKTMVRYITNLPYALYEYLYDNE